MRKLLALFFVLVLAGCALNDRYAGGGKSAGSSQRSGGGGGGKAQSRILLQDVDQSLRCVKKAIAAGIPGGIRILSENRRNYHSFYVDLNGKKWDVVSTDKWRAFADVTILGDRRPYTIEVFVRVEERPSEDPTDEDFRVVGQSAPLAEQVAQRIESKMDICRGDLIDDFRAF